MSDRGKSVRLFLVDGTPGGLITAEIMNWTGHLVAAPRSELADLLKRPEASRTGIYLLLGDDPERLGGTLAYIGEADDIRSRLKQHARPEEAGGKDFWSRVLILTSKDTNLTKAHARYLESRMIELAKRANRVRLVNGTAPPLPNLPEADQSDMEFYLAQAGVVLPVVAVDLLRPTTRQSLVGTAVAGENAASPQASPDFEMRVPRSTAKATAQEIDGEFIVRAGSFARREWAGADHTYAPLRGRLWEDGTLEPTDDGALAVFSRDAVFTSPSAAAAIISGRNANGRLTWKASGTKQTYADWQNRALDEVPILEDAP